MNKTWEMEHLK